MAFPVLELLTTTCSVYRPFGAPTPIWTGLNCRLITDAARGRPPFAGALAWTHYLDLDDEVDIRDGITRMSGSNGLTYADGDEIRIPESGTRYVVVWVETLNRGDATQFKRAYLMRHAAVWPGP